MSETKKIPPDRIAGYFDTFTKEFIRSGSPEAVDVEILDELGDQYATEGARLLGITYDTGTDALEFELDSGDHRIYQPREVWAIEEDDGFISAIEIVRPDGTREVVNVKRVGLQHLE
jgi:hypothetical protein